MKIEDLTVESIAQMDMGQRQTFVSTLVKKWPHLANDITIMIESQLQDEVDKELDDIQKCEVAYKLTNTIDVPWWKGDMVIPTFPIFDKGCRSTSVGDFVLIGNTKYKCASFGWEKV